MAVWLTLSAGGIMSSNHKVNAAQLPGVTDSVIQARGVWHRPNVTGTETDLEGMCSVLDTFQKTGINLVFLETFFHGMTVYRTTRIPYYTGFDAFDYSPYPDYLSAFVAEAGKRGIQVHAWVEDFYVGVEENFFTKFMPQWLMLTKDGGIRQSEGADFGGYLFLDPANPEVRQYLIDFYDELLTRFPDIAGLNLDYIRYPVSSQEDDTGFTEAAIEGFAKENGLTFPENATREEKVNAVAQQYGKWVNYRANQVTTFVGQVFDMVKQEHPNVLLSTAVFPEQGKSFGDKKQDFNTWLSRGYLDIITPMAYYDDVATLKRALEAMLPGLSACYCYAGISPTYHNLPDQQVLDQMQTAIDTGADGFVFFGSQSILNNRGYIDLLEDTISGPALLPHTDAKALIEATAQTVEKKLAAAGASAEQTRELLGLLEQLAQTAVESDHMEMEHLRDQLQLLIKYNLGTYVSEENLNAVKPELERLFRYIGVKTTRLQAKFDRPADGQQPVSPEQGAASEKDASGNKYSKLTHALGLGAAIAAAAAAIATCFHIIRKGRKKK